MPAPKNVDNPKIPMTTYNGRNGSFLVLLPEPTVKKSDEVIRSIGKKMYKILQFISLFSGFQIKSWFHLEDLTDFSLATG